MRTDADLVTAYLAGDEEAFVELVRRHAGMVFGVCTRALGSVHDAEDAFQATFIVLARRAADVCPPSQVGRWLYGVARRIAMKAKSRRERRRVVETMANATPRLSGGSVDVTDDFWEIIDEEAARLPERLLSPFILCDLEGLTYRDAARRLGLAEGTLSNRLAAARRMLASWLTHRGILLPAGGLTPLLVSSRFCGGLNKLVASTVEAANSSTSLFPLAEEMMRTMMITKIVTRASVLMLVLGLTFGSLFLVSARGEDKELKKLDGEWTAIKAERSGKAVPGSELKMIKVTIKGGTMTIITGARQEAVTIKVDATTSPKSIDLQPLKRPRGDVELGIYELDGDQLRICWGAETVAGERTREFRTTPKSGGRLLVLRKAKAK